MLLAIPLAAILTYIYSEIIVPWLKDRKKVKDEAKELEEAKAEKNKIRKDGKAG